MAHRTITHGSALAALACIAGLASATALASCSSHPGASPSGAGSSSTTASNGSNGSNGSTGTSGTMSTSSGGVGGGDAGGPPSVPFQADPPNVYVAKVKNLLVGLPPTADEIASVATASSPRTALQTLIQGWMTNPATKPFYDAKMQVFFSLAFQQTQLTSASFIDMLLPNGIGVGSGVPLLVQNIQESFARTMIYMADQHRPLTDAMTTDTFMMTPALMELYAFLDYYHVDDDTNITDPLKKEYGSIVPNIVQQSAVVSLTDSADSTNKATFLHFTNPGLDALTYQNGPQGCSGEDPIAYPLNSYILHWLLYGAVYNHQDVDAGGGNCGSRSTGPNTMAFSASDFTTWAPVKITTPTGGQTTTRFFDIPTLRSIQQQSTPTMVLNTARIGYFSTPAFFANWSTNSSNQMRVTTNQALLVATGLGVDGTDVTTQVQLVDGGVPALDAEHAPQGGACFPCHQYLDPTRAIFSSTWTYPYYQQLDAGQIAQKGEFAFQGVVKFLSSIHDFGSTLASHPLVPDAWVQKLCYYANSKACDTTDPEYATVKAAFTGANLDWSTLVVNLLSSPLTTNAKMDTPTEVGPTIAVARRDHLCAALNNRLNLTDVCGLLPGSPTTAISTIVSGLPSDGYGRGSGVPVLPTQPTLFYRGGLENICEGVASLVIDNAKAPTGAKTWSSSTPASVASAISDFATLIMSMETVADAGADGGPGTDPRYAAVVAALTSHFTSAQATMYGASATTALRSTFTVACLSPSFAGIGM